MNPVYPSPENLPGGSVCPRVLPFSLWDRSCFFLTAGRLSPREEALCGRPSPSQERAPEGRIPPTLAPLIWPLPEKAIWLPPSRFLLVWKLLPRGWGSASSRPEPVPGWVPAPAPCPYRCCEQIDRHLRASPRLGARLPPRPVSPAPGEDDISTLIVNRGV